MATTTYKGYELISTGTENNTWGSTLNSSVFNRVDQNLGGIVSKSLTNSNVSLTADESRQAIVRLTGTLSANVQITTACQGFFFVENLCTLGAFAVTVTNGVSGVTAPAGRSTMIADATNGVRVAATATFPTGTSMPFQQTAAPTGWTKSAAHNDKALRVVSGTASSGGTTAFSTVFTARTIARANLPNDSITTSSDGAHTHVVFTDVDLNSGSAPTAGNYAARAKSNGNATDYTILGSATTATLGLTTSNGAHTHTVALNGGVSQTTMDFAVQYLDLIIATKD